MIVGFEQPRYTVNESDGIAKVCVQLHDTERLLNFSVVLFYTSSRITAGKHNSRNVLSLAIITNTTNIGWLALIMVMWELPILPDLLYSWVVHEPMTLK